MAHRWVNNAVSRLASLLAVAVLPLAAGIHAEPGSPLGEGFPRAMLIAAVIAVAGGFIAFVTIRTATPVPHNVLPGVTQPCQHPCTREGALFNEK